MNNVTQNSGMQIAFNCLPYCLIQQYVENEDNSKPNLKYNYSFFFLKKIFLLV